MCTRAGPCEGANTDMNKIEWMWSSWGRGRLHLIVVMGWTGVTAPCVRTGQRQYAGGGIVDRTEGERLATLLELEALPDEGGLFRRTHIDAHSSAIYYMLIAPEFSAMHALTATETYHWYAGAPLRMLLLHPDGTLDEPVLGPDIAAGQRPQIVVPAQTWQGSSAGGAWSLVGTTTAPPFEWAGFGLGDRAGLVERYPTAAARIVELTRLTAPGTS